MMSNSFCWSNVKSVAVKGGDNMVPVLLFSAVALFCNDLKSLRKKHKNSATLTILTQVCTKSMQQTVTATMVHKPKTVTSMPL